MYFFHSIRNTCRTNLNPACKPRTDQIPFSQLQQGNVVFILHQHFTQSHVRYGCICAGCKWDRAQFRRRLRNFLYGLLCKAKAVILTQALVCCEQTHRKRFRSSCKYLKLLSSVQFDRFLKLPDLLQTHVTLHPRLR